MSSPLGIDRSGHHLDWNLLRTFLVIVEEGGVTRAACRLGLTQPAVSQALKRLEDQLGCPLIERGQGRFAVTRAGALIHEEVRDIFGTIARFGLLVHDAPGQEVVSGTVRLLLVSRIEAAILDAVLQRFNALHPAADLRIDVMASADIHTALQQKAACCGIGLLRDQPAHLEHRMFTRQTFRFYCGPRHRLFGRSGLEPADLKGESWVSFTSDQIDGMMAPLAVFRVQEGLGTRIAGASSNMDEVRRMIVAGLGIGPLPMHAAARAVAEGRLWPLPPEEGVCPMNLHLMWNPAARLNRAEQAFLAVALDALESIPPERRFDPAACAAWMRDARPVPSG